MLHRPAAWNTTAAGYSTSSSPISLGGFYYPLAADGTVGRPMNTIRLRAGEGAILLKRRPVTR